MIIISETNKPAALAALYNASSPIGLGFLHAEKARMSVAEAAALLTQERYFDYLKGRVMKVDFDETPMFLDLYDRDNGSGAGIRALEKANVPFTIAPSHSGGAVS